MDNKRLNINNGRQFKPINKVSSNTAAINFFIFYRLLIMRGGERGEKGKKGEGRYILLLLVAKKCLKS